MKLEKKAKRLAILGAAFFVLGLFFFVFDRLSSDKQATNPPNNSVSSSGVLSAPVSSLSTYPAPETFKKLSYGPGSANSSNLLDFSGECFEKYLTILIFPSAFDYRQDPAKAVYNRANLCPSNGKFDYKIYFSNLKNLPAGDYYAFVADQQEGRVWYNPR